MSARDKYLRKTYGISEETFNAMLALGDGKCWICHREPKKTLNVDHDHKSGQVRGLLCGGRYQGCNRKLIGDYRREHAVWFRRAADYLLNEFDWRDHSASKTTEPKKSRKRKTRRK